MGPDGTLFSPDLAGILFPAVPAGIPFPVGPVGPFGTLSPPDSAGPVGPKETLSPSDFEYAGTGGPVGTLPSRDNVTGLCLIIPVVELSSVDPDRRAPGGLVPVVGTGSPDGRDPVITQSPPEMLVGDCRDVMEMDVTVDSYQAVPNVIADPAVV